MKRKLIFFICLPAVLYSGNSCTSSHTKPQLNTPDISRVIAAMTLIMLHDVTNPPLAARFYAYTCLAGFEVVTENDPREKSLQSVLNDYPHFKATSAKGYDYRLSSLLAMMETAAKLQPSGSLMLQYKQRFLDSCTSIGYQKDVIDSSENYALTIAKEILAYAKTDGYRKISNYKRYVPSGKSGTWYPTPPAYLQPVEPYFKTVRPFTLDSSSQFKPAPPVEFSTEKNSSFSKLMRVTYECDASRLSVAQREIAAFWDCNPFAVQDNGHMLIGLKKISPGAHWMGITAIACSKSKTDFSRAMEIHTVVAMGLMDSFICCWDEKYRSNRIRPETAIHQLLNPDWKPLLQTPPFPEYLSGHSCISATSAVLLSHYFGEHFEYTDTIENRYGIKPRTYHSFNEAAIEAGISRLYGGIHFKDAIDNGRQQGIKVGNWVLNRVAH
ncbi:MAG TPA: vanadium-dependent haloperoxidase [Mucilaginibacter sp.]|nr:vanadium-dependent haloperoxidase [Mucilaginibacter sp.]